MQTWCFWPTSSTNVAFLALAFKANVFFPLRKPERSINKRKTQGAGRFIGVVKDFSRSELEKLRDFLQRGATEPQTGGRRVESLRTEATQSHSSWCCGAGGGLEALEALEAVPGGETIRVWHSTHVYTHLSLTGLMTDRASLFTPLQHTLTHTHTHICTHPT